MTIIPHMWRRLGLWFIAVCLLGMGWTGARLPKAGEPNQYRVDDRRSGYTYLSEENQRWQDDDFANPGLLWVEQGRELWQASDGVGGQSCASCHGDATDSMRGVRTRYPRFDPVQGKLINLEQQINRCRAERLQAEPYRYESDPLLALTTFVSAQSRGLPVAVQIDGPARPFLEAGRLSFYQRRGQLDLSCAHCHERYAGERLRGDVISQGQLNGFPVYRLTWQTLGSTHRMFAWCNTSVRAEPYPYGSEAYVNLELYLAWRGRGLPVETPAIRRCARLRHATAGEGHAGGLSSCIQSMGHGIKFSLGAI